SSCLAGLATGSSERGYQSERTPPSSVPPLAAPRPLSFFGTATPCLQPRRGMAPRRRPGERKSSLTRIPVVDMRGVPQMPCTPPKARAVLKAGKARPKRNKLDLFYVHLLDVQEPTNQLLVAGVDPGSTFEGDRVVGTGGHGVESDGRSANPHQR